MPRTIEILTEAEAEAAEARAWYAARSISAASGLLNEIDVEIAEHPERRRTGQRGTRRYRLNRFPFVIVYTFDDARIRIIAVAHAKRRPNYWMDRL